MDLIQALLVIFAIIALGIICERVKAFNHHHTEGLQLFLFKIGMPCYLFIATLHHDIASLIHVPYIACYLLSLFGVMTLVLSLFKKEGPSALCVKILASGYSNTAIYTLPIVTILLKDPSAAIMATLMQVTIVQTTFVSTLTFLHHKEQSLLRKLLRAFGTPLIIMPILGLSFNVLGINPYPLVITTVQSLGEGASGLALFTFGLTVGSISLNRETVTKSLISIVLLKNVAHPLIAFMLGKYVFHLDPYWLYALVIAASAPTAFVVYLIAKQFDHEPELIKRVVGLSAMASLLFLVLAGMIL